jgi:hypothetical protein
MRENSKTLRAFENVAGVRAFAKSKKDICAKAFSKRHISIQCGNVLHGKCAVNG